METAEAAIILNFKKIIKMIFEHQSQSDLLENWKFVFRSGIENGLSLSYVISNTEGDIARVLLSAESISIVKCYPSLSNRAWILLIWKYYLFLCLYRYPQW